MTGTYSKFFYSALLVASSAHAHVLMNVTRPHEWLVENRERTSNKWFTTDIMVEHGFNAVGFNADHQRVNEAKAWNCDQDAIKMLEGFPSTGEIGQLRTRIDGLDDGIRGHFDVCADLKMNFLIGLGSIFYLPHNFSIGVALPFYGTELKNVSWREKTLFLNPEDALIKTELTNNFFENVRHLGQGLHLGGWKRAGVGDMTVLAMWQQNFIQKRPLLKNVLLQARAGVSLPTGRRVDEDVLMSVPYGNDGALGIIWGGGITVSLGCHINLGADVELMHLFGNTRMRRIKTHMDQTELLLLAKVKTYKSWGFTQRFNLHAHIYDLLPGVSTGATYQFLKRGDDTISLRTNEFSESAANSANMVQQRSVQSVLFDVSYDAQKHMDPCLVVIPNCSFFYRLPFKGENTLAAHSFGFGFGLRF